MPLTRIFPRLTRAQQQARERRLRELLAQKGRCSPEKIDDLVGCAYYYWLSDADRDAYLQRSGQSREQVASYMQHGLRMMFQYKDVAELVIGDKERAAHEHQAALQWLVSLQHGVPDDE